MCLPLPSPLSDLRAPPTGTLSADGDSLALLAEGDQDDEAEEATAAPEQEDAVEEEDGAPQESNVRFCLPAANV